jgi:hypothetical protein
VRPAPQPLVRLVLVLFAVWAGAALAYRTGFALTGWDTRRADRPACLWRLATGPVASLRRCLAGVEGRVPRDSVVVFDSPPGPCGSQFFCWRWAAYLLPNLEVSLPGDPDGSRLAAYVIAYRTEPAPCPGTRLVLIRRLADGSLYRIDRP